VIWVLLVLMPLNYSAMDVDPPPSAFVKEKGETVDTRGLPWPLLLGPVAGQGFDAVSTLHALHNNQNMEGNPALRNLEPAKMLAMKAALGFGTSTVAQLIAKKESRKAGIILAALGSALPIGFGIHNMVKSR
jgi:hypothetical protein